MHKRKAKQWLSAAIAGGALAAGTLTLLPATAQAKDTAGSTGAQADYAAAAERYDVPVTVLMALAHQASGWQEHDGYSNRGGWGPLDLTEVTPAMVAGTGTSSARDLLSAARHPELHTVTKAAGLTGIPADRIRNNPRDNIAAGAALLHSDQERLGDPTSDDPAAWTASIAEFSGLKDEGAAKSFVDDVFATISKGATARTPDGVVTMRAAPSAKPAMSQLGKLKLAKSPVSPAECPKVLNCQYVQASSTGLQVSNRPANGITIDEIVLHTTEGSYESAIQTFQGPNTTAAQYVMAADGRVTQMVQNKDVAFGDGNYASNLHSIQIEHEGFSAHGADWYNDTVYQKTAKLVKFLADRYDIPLDRQHIVGHDNVPGPNTAGIASMHWDMGHGWDWTHFMKMIDAPFDAGTHAAGAVGTAVTIAPTFKKNPQTFTVCPEDDPTGATAACTQVTEPANSLFVRQAPADDAPLVLDPAVHPTATSGTDRVSDWSTTVQAGQQFVVAGQEGDWTALWFAGQKGWIKNPGGVNTIPAENVKIVRPAGTADVPVYGTAFPDVSEVPASWGPDAQNPLGGAAAPNYRITTGQAYVADQPPVHGSDFFPSRQGVIIGAKQYYRVQFNHRYVYVNAADVTAESK